MKKETRSSFFVRNLEKLKFFMSRELSFSSKVISIIIAILLSFGIGLMIAKMTSPHPSNESREHSGDYHLRKPSIGYRSPVDFETEDERVFVVFVKVNSAPCIAYLRVLDDYIAENKNVTVKVFTDDSKEEIERLIEKEKFDFEISFDKDGVLMKVFDVIAYPTTFYVYNGIVKNLRIGSMKSKDIERMLFMM